MIFVDWIMAVSFMVSIVLLVYIAIVSRRNEKFYSDKATKLAVRQRNGYICSSAVFAFIHYWCILTSILSTLIVLYIGCFEDTNEQNIKVRMILYSALSLFTTICPYVVNLLKISRKYRKAFCIIETAILKDGDCGSALADCEKVIAEGFED